MSFNAFLLLLGRVGQEVVLDTRRRLFIHFQRLSIAFHEKYTSGRVISRQTTSRYRNQAVDVAAVGAELHVRYVLEGSVRMQDGGLRVNVNLSDPATRLPVWSGRVERDGADRHAIRDEIVGRIARELPSGV